ncbi:MAG: sulfite exporter TauE/SafE family protein [Planctomycetota bacterium]|nr:sulfite exporter TauE/SafE family protein [Planctomycetota bacterium]
MFIEQTLLIGMFVVLIAFIAEYVDSTLGMGYGTTLTPVLLLMGYEPMQVVPAILLSELLTGILAGLAHHKAGNVNFRPKLNNGGTVLQNFKSLGYIGTLRQAFPRHLKTALLIASCSILGTLAAVLLAVSINRFYIKLYIGIMVLLIGVVILLSRKKEHKFSWKRVTALGLVASFNKGMSGGGYGPVVTGGQILAGVDGKNAIGITSLAEGLTCIVGFGAYFCTMSIRDWTLFPFLCVGAVLSVPLSAYTVKQINTRKLRVIIGIITVFLGAFTLSKVLL